MDIKEIRRSETYEGDSYNSAKAEEIVEFCAKSFLLFILGSLGLSIALTIMALRIEDYLLFFVLIGLQVIFPVSRKFYLKSPSDVISYMNFYGSFLVFLNIVIFGYCLVNHDWRAITVVALVLLIVDFFIATPMAAISANTKMKNVLKEQEKTFN